MARGRRAGAGNRSRVSVVGICGAGEWDAFGFRLVYGGLGRCPSAPVHVVHIE